MKKMKDSLYWPSLNLPMMPIELLSKTILSKILPWFALSMMMVSCITSFDYYCIVIMQLSFLDLKTQVTKSMRISELWN